MPSKATTPKKSLGQHWLRDQSVLDRIIAAAQIQPGEQILEIGPGEGVLTKRLLAAGARVLAIEKDESLIPSLHSQFPIPDSQFQLIPGDVLEVNLPALLEGRPYRVIANIPYYLSGRLFRFFFDEAPRPSGLILLIQREVAERLISTGSLLGLSAALSGETQILFSVPATAFHPRPKVQSAVVEVKLYSEPGKDAEAILVLARHAFAGRRKQLRNSLAAGLHLGAPRVEAWLNQAEISPTARPEELGVEEWRRLVRAGENV